MERIQDYQNNLFIEALNIKRIILTKLEFQNTYVLTQSRSSKILANN